MKTDVFANRHIGITDSDLPRRHIGITDSDLPRMLGKIGVKTIDELIDKVIPKGIRLKQPLDLPPAMTEREFAGHIARIASHNKIYKSYIGTGWVHVLHPLSDRDIPRTAGSVD